MSSLLERIVADLDRTQSVAKLHAAIQSHFANPADFYQACLLPRCTAAGVVDSSALAQLVRPTHPCNSLLGFKRQIDDKPAPETFSSVAFSLDGEVSEASSKIAQFPTFDKFSQMENKQKKAEIDRFLQMARSLSELLKRKIDGLTEQFQATYRAVTSDLALLKQRLQHFKHKQLALQDRLQAFSDKTNRLRSLLKPLQQTEDPVFESIKLNRDRNDLASIEAVYQQFSLKQANVFSVVSAEQSVSRMADLRQSIEQLLQRAEQYLPAGLLQQLAG